MADILIHGVYAEPFIIRVNMYKQHDVNLELLCVSNSNYILFEAPHFQNFVDLLIRCSGPKLYYRKLCLV